MAFFKTMGLIHPASDRRSINLPAF